MKFIVTILIVLVSMVLWFAGCIYLLEYDTQDFSNIKMGCGITIATLYILGFPFIIIFICFCIWDKDDSNKKVDHWQEYKTNKRK